ncbi:MAG TPA: hypothetical protein VHH32_08165 [Gemmatimonadales bacterium]|nr:hypothetical protein [Gemmatimonadales bacterium]
MSAIQWARGRSSTWRRGAGLVALALTVAAPVPVAEAQAQQTALPAITIDTVSFGIRQDIASVEWSVQNPPQPTRAQAQPTGTQPQATEGRAQTTQRAQGQSQTSQTNRPQQPPTVIQSFTVVLELTRSDGTKKSQTRTVDGSTRSVSFVTETSGFTTFKVRLTTNLQNPTTTAVVEKTGSLPPSPAPSDEAPGQVALPIVTIDRVSFVEFAKVTWSVRAQPSQAVPQIQSFTVALEVGLSDGSKQTETRTLSGSERSFASGITESPNKKFTSFKVRLATAFQNPDSTVVVEKAGRVLPRPLLKPLEAEPAKESESVREKLERPPRW